MADWWACHANGGSNQPEDIPTLRDDETSPESLDYFAPAFHRAFGWSDHRTAEASPGSEVDAADEDPFRGRAEDSSPKESLDYFAPAFRRALGQKEELNAADQNGACSDAVEDASEDAVNGEASGESLDYFAPAFRRALGRREQAESEFFESEVHEDASQEQGAVAQLGETVQGLSDGGLKHLSGLEISEISQPNLDVDRLVERVFTSQPREFASVNGG